MTKQTIVAHVDPSISRRLRAFIGSASHGYESLSEFIEVAIVNQLEAEGAVAPRADRTAPGPRAVRVSEACAPRYEASAMWLDRPGPSSRLPLAEDSPSNGNLSPFTNRLAPIKVAARVAASLSDRGEWPQLAVFHQESAAAARWLGLRLKETHQEDPRIAVGFPVGADPEKSLARFVSSFTISERDGVVGGPLAVLGMASVNDGRVLLTKAGWRLAAAPNPLMDNNEPSPLSDAEATVFRSAIRGAHQELTAVRHVLKAIEEASGVQGDIDAILHRDNPSWSKEMVIAHRAAMIGRLSDAQVLRTSGRGPGAVVELTEHASDLLETPSRRQRT